jgi:hypothetical protein
MYFLNRFKYVNLSIFVISGILLVAMSLIPVAFPAFFGKLLGTIMMLPLLGVALAMTATKFKTGPSKPPKALGVFLAFIGAFGALIFISMILSLWLNLPALEEPRFQLPFIYMIMLAAVLTTGGRFIARKTTNPLLILD